MNLFSILNWLRGGYKPLPGAGRRRAVARLAAKREANERIPSGERVTRQRIRQQDRLLRKRARIMSAERSIGGQAIRPSWRHYVY